MVREQGKEVRRYGESRILWTWESQPDLLPLEAAHQVERALKNLYAAAGGFNFNTLKVTIERGEPLSALTIRTEMVK